jgi:Malectin domain
MPLHRPGPAWKLLGFSIAVAWLTWPGFSATTQTRYYAHQAVHDGDGLIAPWSEGLNGQCDFRVRVAAETLKRYPWTDTNHAVAAYPDYLFTSLWKIDAAGTITPKTPANWMNGDLGQRATSLLNGWVDYYRYTGDPAAIAHLTYLGKFLLDYCVTGPDHPWPGLFVSVPTKGKPYGRTDPHGMIQLDICASAGQGLLRAYQLTGHTRWRQAAEHWGELLAQKCNLGPNAPPWGRYANPEDAPWKDNLQTGGVTMILAFLDDLIRVCGADNHPRILAARDAGRRYLRDKLLPAWAENDTWGRYFWDWPNPTQNCITTPDAAFYLLNNTASFPNWRNDSRNILTLFLNRSSVAPESNGDMYSGAWAFPESNSCCGRSLWYSPFLLAPALAQLAAQTDSVWCRELAYRMIVLQTYDALPTGVTEDNIDGGVLVNGDWLNIAHPLPLRWMLAALAWLPEELGANRENHIVRSSAVVNSVFYHKGRIDYSTFDAPRETIDVLRLAFIPESVLADGRPLLIRNDLNQNGYHVKDLGNGDAIVSVRHDQATRVAVTGRDPQEVLDDDVLAYDGSWRTESDPSAWARTLRYSEAKGAAVTAQFTGNQVRLIGRVDPAGGLADVYLDDVKQLVPIDCWNPSPRSEQVLYFRNGLPDGPHTLKIVARGVHNPYATDHRIYIDAVQFSAAQGKRHFPTNTGPRDFQRMIFGYTGREDYRDTHGHPWRPATEWVTRLASGKDPVAECWWTRPVAEPVSGTPDPTLYGYGIHARDFWANLTVGSGRYYVRLKFAATRGLSSQSNCFDIRINGRPVVQRLDVAATAGGPNRAVDLVFNDVAAQHGAIEVRFTAARTSDSLRGQAFVQALELGPGDGGAGANPVTLPGPMPGGNLLLNPGFEETVHGATGGPGSSGLLAEWNYALAGSTPSYVWQELDYNQHPDWGLPEFHNGQGALRTHTDQSGSVRIHQDVEVSAHSRCTASVWVRAVDLRGKGFGTHPDDSAGLIIAELDAAGKLLRRHDKVELKKAGPYTRLSRTITTGPDTAQIRFLLETDIHCPYQEGHVTYDDASVVQQSRTGF